MKSIHWASCQTQFRTTSKAMALDNRRGHVTPAIFRHRLHWHSWTGELHWRSNYGYRSPTGQNHRPHQPSDLSSSDPSHRAIGRAAFRPPNRCDRLRQSENNCRSIISDYPSPSYGRESCAGYVCQATYPCWGLSSRRQAERECPVRCISVLTQIRCCVDGKDYKV